MKRGLTYAAPALEWCRMVLAEPTGETLRELECERSWWRIDSHGRRYRLAGRDQVSGELVYLPEDV